MMRRKGCLYKSHTALPPHQPLLPAGTYQLIDARQQRCGAQVARRYGRHQHIPDLAAAAPPLATGGADCGQQHYKISRGFSR